MRKCLMDTGFLSGVMKVFLNEIEVMLAHSKMMTCADFHGGPVVKTPSFYGGGGCRFNPLVRGTKMHMLQSAATKKKVKMTCVLCGFYFNPKN